MQAGQRVAATAISDLQNGHSLVATGAGSSSRRIEFMAFTTAKMDAAMMRKLITVLMKDP